MCIRDSHSTFLQGKGESHFPTSPQCRCQVTMPYHTTTSYRVIGPDRVIMSDHVIMPYHVAMSYHVSNPCHAIMSYRVTMPAHGMPCHHAIPFMQHRAILSYHVIRGYIVTMPYHVIMSYPLVMPYHASMPGGVIMPYHAIPCRSCHAMPYRAQCRGQVWALIGVKGLSLIHI